MISMIFEQREAHERCQETERKELWNLSGSAEGNCPPKKYKQVKKDGKNAFFSGSEPDKLFVEGFCVR